MGNFDLAGTTRAGRAVKVAADALRPLIRKKYRSQGAWSTGMRLLRRHRPCSSAAAFAAVRRSCAIRGPASSLSALACPTARRACQRSCVGTRADQQAKTRRNPRSAPHRAAMDGRMLGWELTGKDERVAARRQGFDNVTRGVGRRTGPAGSGQARGLRRSRLVPDRLAEQESGGGPDHRPGDQ